MLVATFMTVINLSEAWFSIGLLPHSLEVTDRNLPHTSDFMRFIFWLTTL